MLLNCSQDMVFRDELQFQEMLLKVHLLQLVYMPEGKGAEVSNM